MKTVYLLAFLAISSLLLAQEKKDFTLPDLQISYEPNYQFFISTDTLDNRWLRNWIHEERHFASRDFGFDRHPSFRLTSNQGFTDLFSVGLRVGQFQQSRNWGTKEITVRFLFIPIGKVKTGS